MPEFIMRSPDEFGSDLWQPSKDPIPGSNPTWFSGLFVDPVTDQRITYGNRFSPDYWQYLYTFDQLSFDDLDNVVAFQRLVGNGIFVFREGTNARCAWVRDWRPVRFAPSDVSRSFARLPQGGVGFSILLRDAVAPT